MAKQRLSVLKSQLPDFQWRLDSVLGITVTQHYQWVYGSDSWEWSLPIPLAVFIGVKGSVRLMACFVTTHHGS